MTSVGRSQSPRAILATVLGVLLSGVVGVLVSVGPSADAAASHTGDLRVKGPANSAYTQASFVSQVGKVGSVLTYTIQVTNKGSTLAQFKVRVTSPIPADLYDGSLNVGSLGASAEGFVTKPIAPGGNQVLTVKVKVPSHVNTGHRVYTTQVLLYGTDDFYIEGIGLITNEAAIGIQYASQMYSKSGGQLLVGGGGNRESQYMTAATISSSGTATFNITLYNQAALGETGFQISNAGACPGNFVLTVKDGAKVITSEAMAGYWVDVPQGSKKYLTVTAKALGASCVHNLWKVDLLNWANAEDYLLVNIVS